MPDQGNCAFTVRLHSGQGKNEHRSRGLKLCFGSHIKYSLYTYPASASITNQGGEPNHKGKLVGVAEGRQREVELADWWANIYIYSSFGAALEVLKLCFHFLGNRERTLSC